MTPKRFRTFVLCVGLFVFHAVLVASADDVIDPTGRPKQLDKGKHTIISVWEDDGVWHLRTSVAPGPKGKGQRIQFSGSITVKGDKFISGEFQGLEKKVKATDADWVFVRPDGKGFDFQFSTTDTNVDALTFKVGPKSEGVTFKLLTAGDDDPKKVIIGKAGVHPDKGEFTIPVKAKEKQ